MAEDQEPQAQQEAEPTPEPRRSLLRRIVLTILVILIFFVAALVLMFSTDKGSKFLLDRALSTQQIIKYEYEGGNLWQGISLKNVLVAVKAVDVKIDRAEVKLGWRAILDKEIHLKEANVRNLLIINKSPPSDKPFSFNEIKLPFVLRVDHADIDKLTIQTASSKIKFTDIVLNESLWSGTELKFKDSAFAMDYLSVRQASGEMDFKDKYPLFAHGIVRLPSLKSLQIEDIYLHARGSLDTVEAGIATQTPDLLTGWTVLHPVRKDVPMQGALNLKNYHWPILQDQQLLSKEGIARFDGDIKKLNLNIATDISGKDIPQGQYTATAHTDLTNQLDITQLNGQLLQGAVNLTGVVGWKDQVSWDLQGRLDKIIPKHKVLPQVAQDFLPKQLDARIASQGNLKQGTHLTALVDFDRYETWNIKLDQQPAKAKKAMPMLLDVAWQGIDRAVPYIGWLSSDQGQVKLALVEGQQNIHVATVVKPNDKGSLPAGQYQAQLDLKNNNLNIPSFHYQGLAGGELQAQALLQLPDQKRQLQWNAVLNAKQFNPQSVAAAAPINRLDGQIKASGFARPNQQIIQLENIQLSGQLANQSKAETIRLTGKSTAAILLHDEKAGGGFKGFAVNYDGSLQSSQLPQGDGKLKIQVAGTPQRININEFVHDGAAGRIRANGLVNLANGIGWDVDASLIRFKPQYFVSSVRGEISGNVKSQGTWSDRIKKISVDRLNLAGMINNKPLRAKGNLAILLDSKQSGFLPQQFEADNLYLVYANNQLQATGNAQNLRLKIDAPALFELYPGLRGRAQGFINVQSRPRLSATANLRVDNFGFNDLLSVKSLSIRGELPTSDTTPTALVSKMQNLRSGNREIQQGNISIAGTRKAHLLKVQASNKLSKFYVQLAGGFNASNDWLGQIQKGDFDSARAHLSQQQPATVIYTSSKKDLFVGVHCWASNQSQLCFDQPLRVSSTRGSASFVSRNLDLADFAAFMPEGLAITGKLNGYAKANWGKGIPPNIDAKLVTRNGVIGLAATDPDDSSTTMNYDEASLIARSVREGLLVRADLKAPNVGTGYANVIINPYVDAKPMRGEVAFNQVQLQILKPFIADVRKIEGNLSLAGKIGGTLSKPQFNGEMRLKNGVISMISLPVNLTNIQLYSSIRQDHASIEGAFNSGRGVGKLTGDIDWKNDPHISLKLKGDKLFIRQAPLITALVDTEMEMMAYPVSKKISVTGKVNVPRALISMPESSASVVPVSSDVRVVKEGDNQLAILKSAKPWDIRADIEVGLGDQVIFQGFNSRIPLLGKLYLSQRGLETAMRANGAIGVSKRVTIEAYGQSLELNRAIARFNGALSNPTLDVDANKLISGSTVGLRVTGTASSPNIQVYNDAGLSEQEAMNALITGRINEGSSSLSQTEGFKSDVNNTIAAAGISLGLGGTRAFTNQIGQTFGLSGLALDAQGTGDDTQVSVTGYITPDLYIRYGVGVFTPVNKLTLRYQMNQRLYLEASQSLEKAIDLFYHWRF